MYRVSLFEERWEAREQQTPPSAEFREPSCSSGVTWHRWASGDMGVAPLYASSTPFGACLTYLAAFYVEADVLDSMDFQLDIVQNGLRSDTPLNGTQASRT